MELWVALGCRCGASCRMVPGLACRAPAALPRLAGNADRVPSNPDLPRRYFRSRMATAARMARWPAARPSRPSHMRVGVLGEWLEGGRCTDPEQVPQNLIPCLLVVNSPPLMELASQPPRLQRRSRSTQGCCRALRRLYARLTSLPEQWQLSSCAPLQPTLTRWPPLRRCWTGWRPPPPLRALWCARWATSSTDTSSWWVAKFAQPGCVR